MPSLALIRWALSGIWRMWRPETRTVTVRVDPGTPTLGIWCDLCRLPSVVSVPLMTVLDDGVYPVGTFTACTEHEPECFEREDDD